MNIKLIDNKQHLKRNANSFNIHMCNILRFKRNLTENLYIKIYTEIYHQLITDLDWNLRSKIRNQLNVKYDNLHEN